MSAFPIGTAALSSRRICPAHHPPSFSGCIRPKRDVCWRSTQRHGGDEGTESSNVLSKRATRCSAGTTASSASAGRLARAYGLEVGGDEAEVRQPLDPEAFSAPPFELTPTSGSGP